MFLGVSRRAASKGLCLTRSGASPGGFFCQDQGVNVDLGLLDIKNDSPGVVWGGVGTSPGHQQLTAP